MELFRFRVVRPVLQQSSGGLDIAGLFDPTPDAQAMREAATALENQAATDDFTAIKKWLTTFSGQLALRGDLVTPEECVRLLPADWRDQAGSAAWADAAHRLALSLVGAMEKDMPAPAVEELCRLLLVCDLVSALARDQDRPAHERTLQTAAEVQAMVSWRHVILPAEYFRKLEDVPPLLARRPGVTDLYVVDDEWNHYDAGELAAVINVLPGETFENRVRHAQEVDTLTATTTTTTTSQQTEQQQTASSSLSESSTKDASLNIGVQGQVQTSGQYGPTQVNTSLGAQVQVSQSQSDSKASTTAYQTVQRAVKTVTQQVTTVQSQRTVTRDSTYDDHKLQNSGNAVTVGLYRWLTEVHYAQLVRYPNRFVLEFQIPEPGAWLRWALQHTPTTDWDNPDPGQFQMLDNSNPPKLVDISPGMITADNYTQLAQKWRVQGLSPPPAENITVGMQVSVAPPTENPYPPPQEAWKHGDGPDVPRIAMVADDTLTVPSGYQASQWTAQLIAFKGWGPYNFEEAWITVGAANNSQQTVWEQVDPGTHQSTPRLVGAPGGGPFDVGGISTGTVPISVYAMEFVNGFTCNVNVTCERLPETYAQWQTEVFDQVAAAYQTLLNAFHQERDTRSQQAGGALVNLAGPPELNQPRAVSELRRMVIQDMRGTLMGGMTGDVLEDGADPFTGPDEPYVPAGQPTPADTDLIQFFEQVLEWENIVYICYPYYWARHDQWVTDAISASADPVFDQFLNAGSARVVVPARPGFENLVLFYLYTGQVWGGSQPPAPNDPDYLSVAQEIEAMQKGAADGTPVGSSWAVQLPTTLLWAGTDAGTLPVNPHPTIPAPPGA